MKIPSALIATLLLAGAAFAQDADMTVLEQGMRLYRSDGVDCEVCHGWQGSGRSHEFQYGDITQVGGPPLTRSTMTRAQMIEMVSCGKIIGQREGVMPQYRGDAWTRELRCWGKTLADITIDERPLWGKRQLNAREIEAVVDYVRAVYQGKTITALWCRKYFPQSPQVCEGLR